LQKIASIVGQNVEIKSTDGHMKGGSIMLGAIIGDIVGSRFEFNNHRSKDFELFGDGCFATDDSIMTLAVAKAIMETSKTKARGCDHGFYARLSELTVKYMREIGRKYPNCGFGGMFYRWVFSDDPKPYNSFGNGAAMRVSPAGFAAKSEREAEQLAKTVTAVTHDHDEGIKGAKAAAIAIYMARRGALKREIRERIAGEYYSLDFTIDSIRPTYRFNETCQETVPQAIECFLESASFEDAIRIAISLGGYSDTIGAITGAIAEAYYGAPEDVKMKALSYLDAELRAIYDEWEVFVAEDEERRGAPRVSVIVPFPDFEKLKASVEKLRAELSMLVLERDELLYVECKNIETAYMLAIGGLEYKAYEIECAILRLKRKAELIQAKKNRQERVVLSKIEALLDVEFAEYQAKLNEQIDKMNAALEHSHWNPLSEEETRELKKLYRTVVKSLHPDLHPDLGEAKFKLFHNAVTAYENGDLNGLRIISAMVAEPALPDEKPEAISQLAKEEERFSTLLQNIKDRISEIKSEYPYTMKALLQNPEKVAARKAELEAGIKQLNETLAYYTAKIEEMLR
jgi:type I restriction enzyme M protein